MATYYEPGHPMQPLDPRPDEHKVSPVHSTASIERCQPMQPVSPPPIHLKTLPANSTADFERCRPSQPTQPPDPQPTHLKATPATSAADFERPTTPYAPHTYPNYPQPAVPYNSGPTRQDEYIPRRFIYAPSHVRHEWNRGSQKRVIVVMLIAGSILSLTIIAIAVGLRFGFYRDRYVCRLDQGNLGFGC